MKKVSANLVLAVMWKGICQLLGWFFGLFGYKRDGKFAKCIWGLFATSGAIIIARGNPRFPPKLMKNHEITTSPQNEALCTCSDSMES